MKRGLVTLMALLPMFGTGCGFGQYVRRNVVLAPMAAFTERADHHRHMQLAREGFMQMAEKYGEMEFSCDYRRGFVDGFADYLDFGGFGEPPPIPPPTYRFFGHMTPEGLAAMDDWKNGFRHGAATAKASNLRELVTLPVFWGPVYPTVAVNPPRTKEPPPQKKQRPEKKPTDNLPEPLPAQPVEPPKPLEPIRPQ